MNNNILGIYSIESMKGDHYLKHYISPGVDLLGDALHGKLYYQGEPVRISKSYCSSGECEVSLYSSEGEYLCAMEYEWDQTEEIPSDLPDYISKNIKQEISYNPSLTSKIVYYLLVWTMLIILFCDIALGL